MALSRTRLDVMAFVLRGEGCQVSTATDANAAVDFLGSQRFDFIVSDYVPGMNGVQLFETLRARGDTTFFFADVRHRLP